MTIEQAFLAAISAMAAAIVALWRKGEASERRCHEDRDRLWAALLEQNKMTCSISNCIVRRRIDIDDFAKGGK